MAVIVLIPLVLLILAALLVGFVVFNVLAVIATLLRWIGVDQGSRVNVRVLEDEVSSL